MSNAAYILYLQGVVADNNDKIQRVNDSVQGLRQAIDGLAQQSSAYSDQIAISQGEAAQLGASNALLANLITYLSQVSKNGLGAQAGAASQPYSLAQAPAGH